MMPLAAPAASIFAVTFLPLMPLRHKTTAVCHLYLFSGK